MSLVFKKKVFKFSIEVMQI